MKGKRRGAYRCKRQKLLYFSIKKRLKKKVIVCFKGYLSTINSYSITTGKKIYQISFGDTTKIEVKIWRGVGVGVYPFTYFYERIVSKV